MRTRWYSRAKTRNRMCAGQRSKAWAVLVLLWLFKLAPRSPLPSRREPRNCDMWGHRLRPMQAPSLQGLETENGKCGGPRLWRCAAWLVLVVVLLLLPTLWAWPLPCTTGARPCGRGLPLP